MGCPSTEQPEAYCAGDGLCQEAVKLLIEFHNTDLCNAVNVAKEGEAPANRRARLLDAWKSFIARRAEGACAEDHVGTDTCGLLNRARSLDILARTAALESHQIGRVPPDEHECEMDFITLSMVNRANDAGCGKRGAQSRYGCRFKGDVAGVATIPQQYNIWGDHEAMISRLTGCFFRGDKDKASWPSIWSKVDFDQKLEQYRVALKSAARLTRAGFKLSDRFQAEGGDPDVLGRMKYYYHPQAMPRCEPRTYDQTAYIKMGYVEQNGKKLLLSSARILPGTGAAGRTLVNAYYPSFPADPGAPAALRDLYQAGGEIPTELVDFKHANRCWPPVGESACGQTDPAATPDRFRKSPKWSAGDENARLRLSCRGATPDKPQWTFRGSCDTDIVMIPEAK